MQFCRWEVKLWSLQIKSWTKSSDEKKYCHRIKRNVVLLCDCMSSKLQVTMILILIFSNEGKLSKSSVKCNWKKEKIYFYMRWEWENVSAFYLQSWNTISTSLTLCLDILQVNLEPEIFLLLPWIFWLNRSYLNTVCLE